MAEEYSQVTAYFLPSLKGNYGPAHFLNLPYAASGSYLDPAHPAELVYFRMPDGQMLLLGARNIAPIGPGPQKVGPALLVAREGHPETFDLLVPQHLLLGRRIGEPKLATRRQE